MTYSTTWIGKITATKNPKCDKWCELSTQFDDLWKGGWLDFIANDNGHHREFKFDNENEHSHLCINIFQTFWIRLHEQERILNRLLRHVG